MENAEQYKIIVVRNLGVLNDDLRVNEYSYDKFVEAVREYAKACCMQCYDYQVILINAETNEIIRQFSSKPKKDVFIR